MKEEFQTALEEVKQQALTKNKELENSLTGEYKNSIKIAKTSTEINITEKYTRAIKELKEEIYLFANVPEKVDSNLTEEQAKTRQVHNNLG